MTPDQVIKKDGCRGGHIEGLDPAQHWDADPVVDLAKHTGSNSPSFCPQHDHEIARKDPILEIIERDPFLGSSAHGPEPIRAEITKEPRQIRRPHDGQPLDRPGGGSRDGGAERRRPPLGQNQTRRTRGIGHASDRADILRVFDAIQRDPPPRPRASRIASVTLHGLAASRIASVTLHGLDASRIASVTLHGLDASRIASVTLHGLDAKLGDWARHQRDPLGLSPSRGLIVDAFPGDLLYWNPSRLGYRCESLQVSPCRSLADPELVHTTAPRAERLSDRVQAVENLDP
jgi:hypothetical protein